MLSYTIPTFCPTIILQFFEPNTLYTSCNPPLYYTISMNQNFLLPYHNAVSNTGPHTFTVPPLSLPVSMRGAVSAPLLGLDLCSIQGGGDIVISELSPNLTDLRGPRLASGGTSNPFGPNPVGEWVGVAFSKYMIGLRLCELK